MTRHPERTAAVANGILVLLVPLLLLAVAAYAFDGESSTSVTVRAPRASAFRPLLQLVPIVAVLLPFTIFAGWRTEVHARQWLEGRGAGWRGVVESGATALGVAVFVLAPGIVRRPAEAAPYVLFYGSAALIMGLLVGLMLRTTALVVLRLQRTERSAAM